MATRTLFITATVACLALPGMAGADSLDGEWCSRGGKSLHIEGPQIVTPGGKKIEGDYWRHRFTYLAPAGEANAGQKVNLQQLDDDTMHLTHGDSDPVDSKAAQIWRRCAGKIS